jgi:HKD family nuclease/regulation of enolase protein 1 (concanavalin A-like superfamily)
MSHSRVVTALLFVASLMAAPARLEAQVITAERLCDSSIEDCRQTLINLIRAETVGIDVGFWFMEDSRYATELIRKWQAGVPIRVIIDTKANTNYPGNVPNINALRNAGIPMRRTVSRYFHWKAMIFAGQNVVQFGSANYSPHAFAPQQPLVDFLDETILFSNEAAIVDSFKRRFDDYWTDTSAFREHANPIPLVRSYPADLPVHADLNFPPHQDFGSRSVARYNAEPPADQGGGIDTIMYRITDSRHTDAVIAAHLRGVPVRLITEPNQYREPARWAHSYNVDRLYTAGVPLRHRRHLGANHQKTTLLRSQRMAIFGSHNWTHTAGQYEHSYFTTKDWIYDWFATQYDRKWNSDTETEPFVPLPPDTPLYVQPSSGALVTDDSVTLSWNAGLWAHKYDIYFGADPNPPLLVADLELGNSTTASDLVTYTVTGLVQNQTYYWRVVSKTMANVARTGSVWNIRTGQPPAPGSDDVVLWATNAPTVRGVWTRTADATAAGGSRLGTANAGVRVSSPLATPTDYFEMSFLADAGVGYRLWIRGKAVSNSWSNDSVSVQFSDSVTSTGAATWRIGSTSATTVTIEDCASCGLAAWGWNDNLTNTTAGALGPLVYFASSGEHTIRVQLREDGLSVDQILLSRGPFLSTSPGTTKNDGTILPEQGGTIGSEEEPPPPPPPPLPAGWSSEDVGAVGASGSANESGGTYTVRGAGADVWGTADALHFAWRELVNDGTITARLTSLTGTQAWTKVGVMIRNGAGAGVAQAFMLVSRDKGLAFQYRTANGAITQGIPPTPGAAPRWVRLQRAGSVITAFVSVDGVNWTTIGSATFTMGAAVRVGLAVSSHSTSALATGTFDNVSVTTP